MSSRSNDSFTDATTMHDKLKAPRSLRGVEDAEIVWDMITKRFPNTAPLLCEMETVIERAEDLLQQLKMPSSPDDDDTSGSFHTPDSRESNATISIGSDIESLAEEPNDTYPKATEHPEVTENAERNHVSQDVHETQVDFESERCSERSIRYEEERGSSQHSDGEYYLHPSPRLDEIKDFVPNSGNNCRGNQEESDNATGNADGRLNANSEERLMAMITEQTSLEGWAKIADVALQEWHDDDEELIDASIKERDSEIESSANKIVDNCLLINNDGKCDETDTHTSDKSGDTKIVTSSVQNTISRSSTTIRHHRSPSTILEEYAKRCNVNIKYEYRSKPNLFVINGDLCGFRAMSCAETQDQAKNELATKILWMVAEHQMDGSKLSSSICGLLDLSREEMLETIAFNRGELRNASQKLYKFCLERGMPVPEYSIRNVKTNQGFMYAAQCAALDHVGVGQGLRRDSAKIAAAENLCQKYVHEAEQRM